MSNTKDINPSTRRIDRMGLYPKKIGFAEILKEKQHSLLELKHNVNPIPPLGPHFPNCDSPQNDNENPVKRGVKRIHPWADSPQLGERESPLPTVPEYNEL
jgi:hypothetical protein